MAKATANRKSWSRPAPSGRPTPDETPDETSSSKELRRVTFNLPEPLYKELSGFAAERDDTMTGLFRWAFGLSKVIWDEVKDGKSRIGVIRDGKVVKEFVINPY